MSKRKDSNKDKEVVYLGRPGNNVKMGIVGMPNVGKSTLFNCLSKLNIPAENYPFCTIDPNLAKVPVPDERFDDLVQRYHPKSEVKAVLTITDIAGLVKGAHEGHGLGSAFLSHIFAVDAIYHVVRCFKLKTIEHVEGSVDPVRDLEIIHRELRLKDLERVIAEEEKVSKVLTRNKSDKAAQYMLDTLKRVRGYLEDDVDIRNVHDWNVREIENLNQLLLLSAKPVCVLANIGYKDYLKQSNKWLRPIKEWIAKHSSNSVMIPFSADFEAKWLEMSEEDRMKLQEEQKTEGRREVKSMMDKIVVAGYHTLGLVHFFTCGEDEVRAWTLRKNTKAPQAAGVIHTDFERGFICAECFKYADLKELETEAAVKKAGKYRQEGKNYVVKDGDILFFKFNVTAPKKK